MYGFLQVSGSLWRALKNSPTDLMAHNIQSISGTEHSFDKAKLRL